MGIEESEEEEENLETKLDHSKFKQASAGKVSCTSADRQVKKRREPRVFTQKPIPFSVYNF
jgi:hypothetical protein